MPKINREEYEILKELDDKWKWIARIEGGAMKTFISKPFKNMDFGRSGSWDIKGNENFGIYTNYGDLFQFIQWEDENPYNIADLIEEYESGETEVKNIEWLKEEIWKQDIVMNKGYIYTDDLMSIINELDEPEILSQEWIDENKAYYDNWMPAVPIIHLKDLLVPKQEEVDRAYKDGYEKGKEHATKVIKPTIPKFVADYIKECKIFDESGRKSLYTAMDSMPKEVSEWTTFDVEGFGKGQELFARAYLDGYTVEKEQKYYARIKGWENVTTGSEAFNWVYFKEKDTVGISKALENKYQAVSFTEYDWKNLGINEHNADFVLVEELEE